MYMVFDTFFRPIPFFELSLYECWIDGQSDELTSKVKRLKMSMKILFENEQEKITLDDLNYLINDVYEDLKQEKNHKYEVEEIVDVVMEKFGDIVGFCGSSGDDSLDSVRDYVIEGCRDITNGIPV